MSVGTSHTCGIKSDGTVECWGNNSSNQLNAPGSRFVQISAKFNYTCGIKEADKSIVCWGEKVDASSPPAGSFIQVAAGMSHACAVNTEGKVVCWGDSANERTVPPEDMAAPPATPEILDPESPIPDVPGQGNDTGNTTVTPPVNPPADTSVPPDPSNFTSFFGKVWTFNSEKGQDEITFESALNEDFLFGKDTKGQIWGLLYNNEKNQYGLMAISEVDGKQNLFIYLFTCTDNCTNITTAAYKIIYDSDGSTERQEGPYPAVVTPKVDSPPVTDSSTFAPFLGKTWIFTSEQGTDEVTFEQTVDAEGSLSGRGSNGRSWNMLYSAEDSIYRVGWAETMADGKRNLYMYAFSTCTTNDCTSLTGKYLIVLDSKGTNTQQGPYDATGQLKPTTTNTSPATRFPMGRGKVFIQGAGGWEHRITSEAEFMGGVSTDGINYTSTGTYTTGQEATVDFEIQVAPADIGQQADLLVVIGVEPEPPFDGGVDTFYYALGENDETTDVNLYADVDTWMSQLSKPFGTNVTLREKMEINLITTGKSDRITHYYLFVGYRRASDHAIVYGGPLVMKYTAK